MITPTYIISDIDKNNNFNFLRLALAFIVVIYHTMFLSGYDYVWGKIFDAHLAVCGFFIISGFLIIRSYWRSKSIRDYFVKRGRRLLPAYYFVILLSVLGLSLLSELSLSEYFSSPQLFKYFLANSFFLNFLQPSLPGVFNGNTINAVNGSLWTIKLEVGFYLIVPLLAFILGKLKSRKQANVFLLVLYVLGYAYQLLFKFLMNHYGHSFYGELAHQLPGFIQYFAVGIFCYVNFDWVNKHKNRLLLPALGILALYFLFDSEILLPVGLGVIILFIAFNFSKLNTFGMKADYSYGTYIFHFPLIQLLLAQTYVSMNKTLIFPVVIIMVAVFAFISWHLIEKRALKRS